RRARSPDWSGGFVSNRSSRQCACWRWHNFSAHLLDCRRSDGIVLIAVVKNPWRTTTCAATGSAGKVTDYVGSLLIRRIHTPASQSNGAEYPGESTMI